MTVDLLPYQKRALAWMLHREEAGAKPAVAGGLLGDDQVNSLTFPLCVYK